MARTHRRAAASIASEQQAARTTDAAARLGGAVAHPAALIPPGAETLLTLKDIRVVEVRPRPQHRVEVVMDGGLSQGEGPFDVRKLTAQFVYPLTDHSCGLDVPELKQSGFCRFACFYLIFGLGHTTRG